MTFFILPKGTEERQKALKSIIYKAWAKGKPASIYIGTTFVSTRIHNTKPLCIKDLGGGVGITECGDCTGTGIFSMPEHSEPCVKCKETGKVFMMFYNKLN